MKITQEEIDAIRRGIVILDHGRARDARRRTELEAQVTLLSRQMNETIAEVRALMDWRRRS